MTAQRGFGIHLNSENNKLRNSRDIGFRVCLVGAKYILDMRLCENCSVVKDRLLNV
jgi:hypothetical protein